VGGGGAGEGDGAERREASTFVGGRCGGSVLTRGKLLSFVHEVKDIIESVGRKTRGAHLAQLAWRRGLFGVRRGDVHILRLCACAWPWQSRKGLGKDTGVWSGALSDATAAASDKGGIRV
jgi:hypothetical protein